MKKILQKILILAAVLLVLLCSAEAQIRLHKVLIGGGGMVGAKNSSDITMSGVFSQIAIEKRSENGEKHILYQGFWVPEGIIDTYVPPGPVQPEKSLANYPNPFQNTTTIKYILLGSSKVTLRIYDMMGNLVKTLYDGYQDSGEQNMVWDARDNSGSEVGSGSYLYELVVSPSQVAGGDGFQPFVLRSVMVIVK